MITNRELLSKLTPDEMPTEEFRDMAILIGVENTLKILHKFEGRPIYFPKFYQRNFVNKWVSFKFNGSNTKELAKDLDVSITTIRDAAAAKSVAGPWKAPKPLKPTDQLNLLSEES